jgi:glycosyltransferase involved in cell wall biosynthesis
MSAAPDISIVLPVYNQADHIGGIVQDYQAALANLKSTAELVLVVNGNRDGSLDCCRELEKTHSEVRALHEEEPGWGRAVRKGLAAAQGNLLCYTNSARTSAYHLVLHMMLGLANPGLVIKANRRLRHPVARRIGSVLYNVECRTFFDLPVWDVNGTPKVFYRDILAPLSLQEDGDLIDLEFVLRCRQLGLQILEVPIISAVRHGGESTTNVFSAFRMYWGAACMWYRSPSEKEADKGPDAR